MSTNYKLRKPSTINLTKQRYSERNVRNILESTSFVIPGNRKATHREYKSDILQERSTQTSKTLVSLNVLDSTRMSPDSLSPKTDYQYDSSQDVNFTLDKIVNTEVAFKRKNCVLRYLHKSSQKEERREDFLPENSLTKVFLEKTRRKSQNCSPRITRSNFLQQTSPLRNIIPIIQEPPFKSQSCAVFNDDFGPPNISNPRFKVRSVRNKVPTSNDTMPVKYFCEKDLALNLHTTRSSPKHNKNHSFMSPTFSSEQKNKMREISNVTKLISPTRRGRSASPKTVERFPSITKKVPYIDKSSSSIFRSMGDISYEPLIKSPRLKLSTSTILEIIPDTNPEHDLVQAISKMRDVDWNISLRGLAEIVEICHTQNINLIYPHMTIINQRIIDMLKSPRSHVCRTTCNAVGHLFELVKDTRRPEFDEIVDTLLCRTADSNKFIKHDANLALDCMVTHIPTLHAIRSLCTKGPDHKNALIRNATARLIVCAVVLAGPSIILNPNNSDHTRRRIILNMVKFLNDKTLETRKYGERIYKLLYSDRMFDIYLRRYLEKDTIQKIKLCFKKHQNGKH